MHELNVSSIRQIVQKRQETWCQYLILVISYINVPMANDKFGLFCIRGPCLPCNCGSVQRVAVCVSVQDGVCTGAGVVFEGALCDLGVT